MKLWKHYFTDRRKAFGAALVSAALFVLIFYLYGLPLEPVLYTEALLAAILLAFFVLPDLAAYWRKAKMLEDLQRNLLSTLEIPAFSETLPEHLLTGALQDSLGRLRELERQLQRKQEDMNGYYTLWAHQIKTPLSAIRLILQSSPGETGDALLQEVFKVERYVEMVLGYSRLDSINSDLRLERCSVHSIVRQAVKKFAPQFIYQKLSLDLQDFDNTVITDEKWLVFVIEQLLSNAIKYTKEGGVSIAMDENDVLVIRDTGIGISPEDLPRIFERGFTGCNGRMEKTSTGLGLYLTKQIVDRLQNRIEILSEPGKGTEVRLYLHRNNVAAY